MGAKMSHKSELNGALVKIADLAKVPLEGRGLVFIRPARRAIADGLRIWRIDREPVRPKQVFLILKDMADDAEALQLKIAQLIFEANPGELNNAGLTRLWLKTFLGEHNFTIADVLKMLSAIGNATSEAEKLIKEGLPEGRLPFKIFAKSLYLAAKSAGGELEISHSEGVRKGTYLEAVELLRSYLPQEAEFWPKGGLGSALETIFINMKSKRG
jgi:hypothetical protein